MGFCFHTNYLHDVLPDIHIDYLCELSSVGRPELRRLRQACCCLCWAALSNSSLCKRIASSMSGWLAESAAASKDTSFGRGLTRLVVASCKTNYMYANHCIITPLYRYLHNATLQNTLLAYFNYHSTQRSKRIGKCGIYFAEFWPGKTYNWML